MSDLSEQQEKFCQNVVAGMNQQEAYLQAGYNCDPKHARTAASRLSTNVNVARRIKELREKAAERTEITVERLTDELWRVLQAADQAGDLTNARQCVMDIAKLNGKIIDKFQGEMDNTHFTISPDPVDADEWEKAFNETEEDPVGTAAGSAARLN